MTLHSLLLITISVISLHETTRAVSLLYVSASLVLVNAEESNNIDAFECRCLDICQEHEASTI